MFKARDFRRIARDKLKGRWGVSVFATLIAGLLGGASGGGASSASGAVSALFKPVPGGAAQHFSAEGFAFASDPALQGSLESVAGSLADFFSHPVVIAVGSVLASIGVMLGLIWLVIGSSVELGHNKYYVGLCREESVGVSTLFDRFGIFLKAVGLRLFIGLFVFLWSLLLVVPGIIAAYRYSMAPYLMAQNPDLGVREAVNQSKRIMAGNKGRLFCLQLSFIGWMILGGMTLGIGFLWINPYMNAAQAAFYMDVSGQPIPMRNV